MRVIVKSGTYLAAFYLLLAIASLVLAVFQWDVFYLYVSVFTGIISVVMFAVLYRFLQPDKTPLR